METVNADGNKSRLKLLEALAGSPDGMAAGSLLAERLHCSRQAVFKLVCALRGEGIGIESIPRKGYRLRGLETIDSPGATLIEFMLEGNPLFHSCAYFKETESTQSVLKKLAQQGAPEGIIAVADCQTAGRGRRGRRWQTPAGKDLMFSMLLRPALKPGDVQLLGLAAGIAVRDVIRTYYNVSAELKWPNDVLVNGRKVCGILSEAAGEPDRIYYAVTGIGINVNVAAGEMDEEIRETATSLMIETGRAVPRPRLLVRILDLFAELVLSIGTKEGRAELLSRYRDSCATLGREVRVVQDGEEFRGFAAGITQQGALIVNIDGAGVVFAAADVHHLRLV